MMEVDFVYDTDCPNVELARGRLRQAFDSLGLAPAWNEVVIGSPRAPRHTRGYGSPTVLVDGRDVTGATPSAEVCCRVYEGGDRAPALDAIREALDGAQGRARRGSAWRATCTALPAVGVALLPAVACPACWPLYGGVLATLGLTALMKSEWLFAVTLVALSVAVGAQLLRSRRQHRYGPLGLSLAAAIGVLGGKFWLEADWILYVSLCALSAAAVWTARQPQKHSSRPCQRCDC